MPRGKKPQSYSPQIIQLVQHLAMIEEPQVFEHKLPEKQAQHLRFTIYNYLNAVDRCYEHSPAEYAEEKRLVDIFRKTYKICLIKRPGVTGLSFEPRSMGQLEQSLDEFLAHITAVEQKQKKEMEDALPEHIRRDIYKQTDPLAALGYFSRTARGENYNPEDDK